MRWPALSHALPPPLLFLRWESGWWRDGGRVYMQVCTARTDLGCAMPAGKHERGAEPLTGGAASNVIMWGQAWQRRRFRCQSVVFAGLNVLVTVLPTLYARIHTHSDLFSLICTPAERSHRPGTPVRITPDHVVRILLLIRNLAACGGRDWFTSPVAAPSGLFLMGRMPGNQDMQGRESTVSVLSEVIRACAAGWSRQ